MTPLMKTVYLKIIKNSSRHSLVLLEQRNFAMLKAELELISPVPDLVISERIESHKIFIESHMIAFTESVSRGEIHGDKMYLNRYLEYWNVLNLELKSVVAQG
jgi:hypothetical protein